VKADFAADGRMQIADEQPAFILHDRAPNALTRCRCNTRHEIRDGCKRIIFQTARNNAAKRDGINGSKYLHGVAD